MNLLTRRVFTTAKDRKTSKVSFATSKSAVEALSDLAEALGRTKDELLAECLEECLQEYARNGVIKTPNAKAKAKAEDEAVMKKLKLSAA